MIAVVIAQRVPAGPGEAGTFDVSPGGNPARRWSTPRSAGRLGVQS